MAGKDNARVVFCALKTTRSLIEKKENLGGSKTIINYKITEKGNMFCQMVLDPSKEMFQGIKMMNTNVS